MARKAERQAAILELVGRTAFRSQEELRKLLAARGIEVTQATLSRDIRDLALIRVPTDEGQRYAPQDAVAEEAKPSLEALLPQLFSRVDGVGELVVLHTLASGAQPISEAIDAEGWPEVLGTIAGENTILIVCRSEQARQAVAVRVTRLATQN